LSFGRVAFWLRWIDRGGGECFFLEMELAALRHPFPAKKIPHHPSLCNKVDIVMEKIKAGFGL
jgi:hypothetical protein